MSSATYRERTITTILERWDELTNPMRAGNEHGSGSGLTLMPHEPHCAIRHSNPPRCSCSRRTMLELERLIVNGRDDRDNILTLSNGTTIPLRTATRALLNRYIHSQQRTKDVVVEVKTKRRKIMRTTVRIVVEVPAGPAPKPHVDACVRWLASTWTLQHEPMLPTDLRHVA